MKTPSFTRFLLLLCAVASLQSFAVAATLQVKVTEVPSGNTLIVTNTKRPLKVRLKGIMPPEVGQPFSDAARDHLRMLVFDKAVFIEYTNLNNGYFEARVLLNGVDIASQMLRDGVAWYDRRAEYALTPADRELYAQCEQAARNEKRGLWSDASPIAPWDFVKVKLAQASKEDKAVSFSAYRSSTAKSTGSNRYFGRGDVGPGSIAGKPTMKAIAPNAGAEEWITYRSESPRFSIRVPGNSYLFEFPILDNDMKIVNLIYVVGLSDGTFYSLMWTKGANSNASEAEVADLMVDGLVNGLNHYFASLGLSYTATHNSGRPIRLGNYVGKQYTVSADVLAGFARVVSKRVYHEREIFALAVFNRTGDESAFDFLNSLKISEARNSSKTSPPQK